MKMSDHDEMPALEDDPTPFPHPTPAGHHHTSTGRLPTPANHLTSTGQESDDSDSNSDWLEEDDWEEGGVALCIFCDSTHSCALACLAHIKDTHMFDLLAYISRHRMDQMMYIKLVNFIRRTHMTPEALVDASDAPWDAATYLAPVLSDDVMLMYDVEGSTEEQMDGDRQEKEEVEMEVLGREDRASREELQQVVVKQREVLQRLLQAASCLADDKKQYGWVRTVGDIRPEEDEGYFSSYAHFDIHHEMLSDRVRTESYRAAILNNADLLKGKRVLDLGCGTGILSMFSASAGATVTAVDMSEVIYQAMDIVKENNLDSAITFHKGRLEDLELPHRYHYIVSEWMGYFLLFEGMLDSVIHARDHHLQPGGLLLPNRCSMHLLGIEDLEAHKKLIEFWDNVYGFKMTCMRREVVKEATTEVVKRETVITTAAQIADFNLMTTNPGDTEFSVAFSITASRDGKLSGFAGYFDAFFDLPHAVSFSTGPHAEPTHWKQTVFYLSELRPVAKGEVIEGQITVKRKRREVRALEVIISCFGQLFKYAVE